jgi:hypothetical protein
MIAIAKTIPSRLKSAIISAFLMPLVFARGTGMAASSATDDSIYLSPFFSISTKKVYYFLCRQSIMLSENFLNTFLMFLSVQIRKIRV